MEQRGVIKERADGNQNDRVLGGRRYAARIPGRYPDYMTQGETLDDLKEGLKDLYKDLSSGAMPSVRKRAELVVA